MAIMGKMNTAERVSREMSDNFVFQRSLLAYHAAAQRIGDDLILVDGPLAEWRRSARGRVTVSR